MISMTFSSIDQDHKSSILCATFNFKDTVIASGGMNGDVFLHSVVSGPVAGPLRMEQTQVNLNFYQITHLIVF